MVDPTPVLDDLLEDLLDESEELDGLVAELGEEAWALATPAVGWSVAHQIAHLAWTDRAAALAVTDQYAFAAEAAKALAAPERFVDEGAEEGAALPPARLLATWRTGRELVQRALRGAPAGARFPWFGPPMSAASMATARLMETWAHGQDVADALGVTRAPTDRLRHVAYIGIRARNYAFAVRGLDAPSEEFRVELAAPSGALWTYGPQGAPQRVTGPALDFALLVTQRAHRADLAVRAEGPDADRWLDLAQAFAGPAGPGRAPQRTVPHDPARDPAREPDAPTPAEDGPVRGPDAPASAEDGPVRGPDAPASVQDVPVSGPNAPIPADGGPRGGVPQ